MHPRSLLTLQTQLALPLIPFAIDTLARWLLLRDSIPWYQIPDLVMFLVAYAFFCLGVMVAVNSYSLPSDDDAVVNVELVRQRLLANSIFAIPFAGGISFFKALSEKVPPLNLYSEQGIWLFMIVSVYVCYSLPTICRKYMTYINRLS